MFLMINFIKNKSFIFLTDAHAIELDSDKKRWDDWVLKENVFHIIEKNLF